MLNPSGRLSVLKTVVPSIPGPRAPLLLIILGKGAFLVFQFYSAGGPGPIQSQYHIINDSALIVPVLNRVFLQERPWASAYEKLSPRRITIECTRLVKNASVTNDD